MSDLFLIHHTFEHLKTLDPDYYDRVKNDISDIFSRFDYHTKIAIISSLYDSIVESSQSFMNENLMKNKILPTPQDIKLFNLIHANLSKYEFDFICNFLKQHSSLSSDEKSKLLYDLNPELYDKLLKIGGFNNGSTTV